MIPLPLLSIGLSLLSNWQRILIYAALAAAVAIAIWGHGYHKGSIRLYEERARMAMEQVRIIKQVEVLKEKVRIPYLKTETKIVNHFIEVEKHGANVPVRPTCNTTLGWMRSHDSATDLDQREVGAVDDAGDSGITEARTLEVVRSNYKAYHQVANDLKACRAFVDGLPEATR